MHLKAETTKKENENTWLKKSWERASAGVMRAAASTVSIERICIREVIKNKQGCNVS